MSASNLHRRIIRKMAQRFIERAEALELKGKKRDDAALHYFIGATSVIEEMADRGWTGPFNDTNALAKHLGTICALMISVRGFFAVKELAAEPGADD